MPRLRHLTTPHTVYFLYGRGDELLYVGVTSRGIWRLDGHRGAKSWFSEIERAKFEHYATRELAERVEQAHIRVRKPRYNQDFNGQIPTLYDLASV